MAAALALLLAAPAGGRPIDRWDADIEAASLRFGIPEAWIRGVIEVESGGRTMVDGRPITSHAGAMGLMQLMPGTWSQMRLAHGLGPDPHDPHDNIMAGTAYLRAMYDRFGYPGLFAAYHAGPARHAAHLGSGRRLPAETRAYLASLSRSAAPVPAPVSRHSAATALFVVLNARRPDAPPASPLLPESDGLFVPLGPARR